MPEKKLSATKRRTDRIIRESFITLIAQKTIEKITVQDLCTEADINRATFYRYYTDLYALMDTVADDFFHRLFTEITQRSNTSPEGTTSHTLSLYIHDALDIIEKEKKLCKVLLPVQSSSSFASLLTQSIYEIADSAGEPTEYRHLKLMYMTNGMLSVIEYWLDCDCRIPKDLIAHVILEGICSTFDPLPELLEK